MKSRNLFLSSAVLLSILFVGCASTSSESSPSSNDSTSQDGSSSGSSVSKDEQTKLNLETLKKKVNTDIDSQLKSVSIGQTVTDLFTTGLYGNIYLTMSGTLNYCYEEDSVTSTEVDYNIYDNDVASYKAKSYQESVLYYANKNYSFPESKKIADYEITQYFDDNNKMYLAMEDNYNVKNSDSGTTSYRKDSLVGQGYKTFKDQSDYVLEANAGYSIPDLNAQFLSYATDKYLVASEYELTIESYGDGEVGDSISVKLTTTEESSLYTLYPNIGNYYSSYFLDAKVALLTEITAEFDITENGYEISYMTVDDACQMLQDPYIGYEYTGADIESKGLYLYETEVFYDKIKYNKNGKNGEKKVVAEIPGLSEKKEKINEIKTNAAAIDKTATKGKLTQTTKQYIGGLLFYGEDVLFETTFGVPLSQFNGSKTLTSETIHYADGYVVTNAHDERSHYNFASTPISLDSLYSNSGLVYNDWGKYRLVFTGFNATVLNEGTENEKTIVSYDNTKGKVTKYAKDGKTVIDTYKCTYDEDTEVFTLTSDTDKTSVTLTIVDGNFVSSNEDVLSNSNKFTLKDYDISNGTDESSSYSYTSILNADASGNIKASMTSDDNPAYQLDDYTLYSASTLSNNGYTAESYLAGIVGCNTLLYNYLNNYYLNAANSTLEFVENADGTTTVNMTSSVSGKYEDLAQAIEDTETDYWDRYMTDPTCGVDVVLTATLDSKGRVTYLDVERKYMGYENYSLVTLDTPFEFGNVHFTQTVSYDAVGNYVTSSTQD